MIEDQLPWTIARASGLLAYVLTTVSVLFGLVLHHRWRAASWPRFVTNEVHRIVSLTALLAVAGHGVALLLDPYLAPTLGELLVPLTISYRPVWVAAGIVGGDLLVAVWLSQYLRSWLGYRAWARLHLATYAAWLLTLVHGLAAGSDTNTPWALAIYGGSIALVGGLFVARLLNLEPAAARLFGNALVGIVLGLVAVWAIQGPLSPGWSARAGSSPPRGQTAVTDAASGGTTGSTIPRPEALRLRGFEASFTGTIHVEATGSGRVLVIEGSFSGPADGTLQIALASTRNPAAASWLVLDAPSLGRCEGIVFELGETSLSGRCQYDDGRTIRVGLSITELARDHMRADLEIEGSAAQDSAFEND